LATTGTAARTNIPSAGTAFGRRASIYPTVTSIAAYTPADYEGKANQEEEKSENPTGRSQEKQQERREE